jgi:hypothetical protein
MADLEDMVRSRRWREGHYPDVFERLPTMLTVEELQMLSFLAEHLEGEGAILDLGCFVGGSTFALAHGIGRSPARSRHIHSFDLFELNEATKYRYLYARGLPFFPRSNGLELYRVLTSSFADNLTAHPGDVLTTLSAEWVASRRIAMVFLDLCKSPEITDHITRTLLGVLQPGTWIVQQDFIYEFTPWAIHPFWALRHAIEFVGSTERHSVVFRVTAPISAVELESAIVSGRDPEALAETIENASQWFSEESHRKTLAAARELVLAFPQLRTEWDLMRADRARRGVDDPLQRWRDLDWSLDF